MLPVFFRKLQNLNSPERKFHPAERTMTTYDCKSNFYDHNMHVLIHNLSVKLAIMKCQILIGINGALHHVYCTHGS